MQYSNRSFQTKNLAKTILCSSTLLLMTQYVCANQVNLNIQVQGEGQVLSSDGSISCAEDCDFTIEASQVIKLGPENADNFDGWSVDSCDYGNGLLVDQTPFSIGSATNGAKTIVAADLDGDNDMDVVTIDLFGKAVRVRFNDGIGNFSAPVTVDNLQYPSSVVTADWDGDTDQDIIAVDYSSRKIYWYPNSGAGEFEEAIEIVLPVENVYAIAVNDLNQDGNLDLLVSSFGANIRGDLATLQNSITNAEMAWYLNDGQGSFSERLVVSTGEGAITLDSGDIDQDGDIDAVAALITEGKTVYYENHENQFQQKYTVKDTSGAYGVAVYDVDNDADLDILSAGYWSKELTLHINSGNGIFEDEVKVGNHGDGVSATAMADLNQDGLGDILMGVFNHNRFTWYQGQSVIECAFSSAQDKQVKAYFSENASGSEEVVSEVGGKSGGSSGLLLLSIMGLCYLRKLRYVAFDSLFITK